MVHETGLLVDKFALRENSEIGDALHVVAGGELRIPFGVDLEDDGFSCHLRSRSGDMRGGHAAGTTPFGPKIDQYRDGGVLSDFVKERGIGIDRLACRREWLLACATAAGIGKMRGRHAILRGAIRALSDERHDASG